MTIHKVDDLPKASVMPKAERRSMEEWRPIADFPEYSVSNLGHIRRNATGYELAPKVNQYGVVYVGLMKNGEQLQRGVALLVASTFVPRLSPAFDTPINLNGDRFDNKVDNLTWRPLNFARMYNRQFKDRYVNPIGHRIVDLESGEEFENSYDCAVRCGLLERDIVLSILNRTYTWPTYQQFGILED